MASVVAAAAAAAAAAADWGTRRWSGVLTLVLLLMIAFTYLPLAQCTVFCNEFDTCFPLEKQVNVSDAIREGNKGQVCKVAKTAIECLNEARRDCDNGYSNLPEFIIKGLEEKKSNVTAYKTTYCGTNGGGGLVSGLAAISMWTLWLPLWLSS